MKFRKAVVLLVAFTLMSAVQGLAWAGHGGGHGGGGHGSAGHGGSGHSGGGHGGFGSGHGGFHGRGVLFIGGGFYGVYGPWPYYYYDTYPQWLNDPAEPGAYVEQSAPAAGTPQDEPSWFYCDNPSGYYPYVQRCVSGWQRVSPFVSAPPAPGLY